MDGSDWNYAIKHGWNDDTKAERLYIHATWTESTAIKYMVPGLFFCIRIAHDQILGE